MTFRSLPIARHVSRTGADGVLPPGGHTGDSLAETAQSALRFYAVDKWLGVNASRFHVANYELKGDDATDNTARWLALLAAVVAAGGKGRIVFGEGRFRIGAHAPVAGLDTLVIEGAGVGLTTITAIAGAIDYTRPDASVATGVYQCSPLRFQGLARLELRDVKVDASATGALAATAPYLSILYRDAAGVAGADVGATTLGVLDSSSAPIGTELIFGDIDGEGTATFGPTGAYGVATVTSVVDSRHVTVSPALTFPLTPSGPHDATSAVSRATALGGACVDARDIGHLALRGVELTGALRYGLYLERVGHLATTPDLWIHDIGMQGGFGHATDYPWAGVAGWCGGLCGWDVSTADIDGGVIEESPGQGVYLLANLKRRDFGVVPPGRRDIRLRGTVIRAHGVYGYYSSTGSGIGIVTNRNDVLTRRILIQGCQISDTQDGPIWVMAQDGLVEIVDNEIDRGYGPSIALSAARYRIAGNIMRDSGNGGIQVIASGFADYNPDKGMDVPDGVISENVIDGSHANGISVGTFGVGHPPRSARRTVIAHNVIRETAQDGVYLQDVDGSIVLDANVIRRTNLQGLAAAALSVLSPTTPSATTGRVFYTLTVASGALTFIPTNYCQITDASSSAVSPTLLIAAVPDDQHIVVDTKPTGGSGAGGAFVVGSTVAGAFPGLGAIRIQGRLPFTTTVTGTTAGPPATATVGSVGAAGNGLTQYDRVRFGTDPAVYQIMGVAGLVLTLDRAWDGAAPVGATVVYLNDVYAARDIQIRGGLIGAADEETPSTLDGIALQRVGGLVTVDGVTISRVRKGGIYAEDSQPRQGSVASAIRNCTFNDLGLDGLSTANVRKAAVYLLTNAANSGATGAGWLVEGNRLVDDQPARTAQYGLVVHGQYVDGGIARDNDWSYAGVAAWGVVGSPAGTFSAWQRAANLHPWFMPNNDDIELVEEFPGGEVAATGRVGTHGWRWGGTGTIAIVPPSSASPSNTIGGLQLTTGATATNRMWCGLGIASGSNPQLFDAATAWDVTYIAKAASTGAATDYRFGVMADASVALPQDGCYLERLAADTNWFFVVIAGGVAQPRVDSGVAAFPSGAAAWTQMRVRRFTRAGVDTVAFWVANAAGVNKGTAEIATGLPVAGTALAPAAQVITADNAAKTLQIDRAVVREHGLVRA
jgi:hypothetical protein